MYVSKLITKDIICWQIIVIINIIIIIFFIVVDTKYKIYEPFTVIVLDGNWERLFNFALCDEQLPRTGRVSKHKVGSQCPNPTMNFIKKQVNNVRWDLVLHYVRFCFGLGYNDELINPMFIWIMTTDKRNIIEGDSQTVTPR